MTNPNNEFFDHPTRADRLVEGDVARAGDVNRLFDAVSSAFTRTESLFRRTITLPEGAEMTPIAEALSERSNRVFAFDASGQLLLWPTVTPANRADSFLGWGSDGRIRLWPAVTTEQLSQFVDQAILAKSDAEAAQQAAEAAQIAAEDAASVAAIDAANETASLLVSRFAEDRAASEQAAVAADEAALLARDWAEKVDGPVSGTTGFSAQRWALFAQSYAASAGDSALASQQATVAARGFAESAALAQEAAESVKERVTQIIDSVSSEVAERLQRDLDSELTQVSSLLADAKSLVVQATDVVDGAQEQALQIVIDAAGVAREEISLSILADMQATDQSRIAAEKARDEAVVAAGIAVEAMLSQGDVVGPLEQFVTGIGDGLLLGGGEWVGGLDPNLNASEIGALFDAGYESA